MLNLVLDIDDYLQQYQSQYEMISQSELLDSKTQNSAESFLAVLESLDPQPSLMDRKQSIKFISRTQIWNLEKSEVLDSHSIENKELVEGEASRTLQRGKNNEEVLEQDPPELTAGALQTLRTDGRKEDNKSEACSYSNCSSSTCDTEWVHEWKDPRILYKTDGDWESHWAKYAKYKRERCHA